MTYTKSFFISIRVSILMGCTDEVGCTISQMLHHSEHLVWGTDPPVALWAKSSPPWKPSSTPEWQKANQKGETYISNLNSLSLLESWWWSTAIYEYLSTGWLCIFTSSRNSTRHRHSTLAQSIRTKRSIRGQNGWSHGSECRADNLGWGCPESPVDQWSGARLAFACSRNPK